MTIEQNLAIHEDVERLVRAREQLDIVCRLTENSSSLLSLKIRGARPIIALANQGLSLEQIAEELPEFIRSFYPEAEGKTIRIFSAPRARKPAIMINPPYLI